MAHKKSTFTTYLAKYFQLAAMKTLICIQWDVKSGFSPGLAKDRESGTVLGNLLRSTVFIINHFCGSRILANI